MKQWCRVATIIIFVLSICNVTAQNTMRIHYKSGNTHDIFINEIDSITFVENKETDDSSLLGAWFWGGKEKGYYEVLTFNEDRTYIGYDYYLEYGIDTWTYGTYTANGIMLNLWSNGIGYSRKYRWYVTGQTENALEVMTQMGCFIYYRIQSEVYSLKVGEELYECKEGDYYVFTDGVKVSESNGVLKGISKGTTYILKYNAKSGTILAYKMVVIK